MYYRLTDPADVRDLGEQMAAWLASGNPKAQAWAEQPAQPDPAALWIGGEWVMPEPPERKIWATVTQFWGELPEQARHQIALSDDPNVVVLRTDLAMWRGEVWGDDERVTGALLFLVLLEILSEQEMEQILTI